MLPVRPKKSLGQHFLKDRNIAARIIRHLEGRSGNVLEIGPGMGILTLYLIERPTPNLYLIEIDPHSVDYLADRFPGMQDRILMADFLDFDMTKIFGGTFSIVGNFPYHISSQIVFRILGYRDQVDEVVGMFQKEVGERIASPPGSRKYGILSVLVQAFYEVELLFRVNEQVFQPPPKVKSVVIRLKKNRGAPLDCDEKLFFTVVKTAFNQRRKTLRNALRGLSMRSFPGKEILLSKRAEQLTVDDFVLITRAIQADMASV
jgi:16S rRNA (adenine1518-N6/adenine1519-N6)-dimethyltransferase